MRRQYSKGLPNQRYEILAIAIGFEFGDSVVEKKSITNTNSKTLTQANVLFSLLESVAEYGVDVIGGVSEEVFFKHLYVPRKQEAIINNLVNRGNHFILVIGARGTGKTTIARALEKKWRKDPERFVCYIDARNHPEVSIITQMLATNEQQERMGRYISENEQTGVKENFGTHTVRLAQRLLNAISNDYKKNFPLLSKDGKTISENFLAALDLIYNPTKERNPLFAEFEPLRDKLTLKFAVRHNGFNANFSTWLQESWRNEPLISESLLFTRNNLRVQHWTYLANVILGVKKQVIWVDNIDALTAWQQSNIHSTLSTLFHHIRGNASVLVSVREQNIYKNYDYSEFGVTLFTQKVRLPIVSVGGNDFPALDIMPTSDAELSDILRNRLHYILYESDGAISKGIQLKKPEINKLLVLSTKIKNVLINRKGIFLTNGSVREFLELNIKFLRYLLPTDVKGNIDFNDSIFSFSVGKITNLFLFFIRLDSLEMTRYNIGEMYDLVNVSHYWSNKNELNTGHSINHLVLHAIWNLTLENPSDINQTHKCITVKNVKETLSHLGYSRKAIRNSLFKLYGGSTARSGLIEIQSRSIPHIERQNQISDNDLVNITMRGKVLVAGLANTFSYIFACALQLEYQLTGRIGIVKPEKNIIISDAINTMFPYLCDMAQMCLESLVRVRDESTHFKGKNWYRSYLLYFGIPITPTYSYKHQLGQGKLIHQHKRELQFKLILNGIITFTNSWTQPDPQKDVAISQVIELRDAFNELLDSIIKGSKFEFSFREYFDLPNNSLSNNQNEAKRHSQKK